LRVPFGRHVPRRRLLENYHSQPDIQMCVNQPDTEISLTEDSSVELPGSVMLGQVEILQSSNRRAPSPITFGTSAKPPTFSNTALHLRDLDPSALFKEMYMSD
jgi:hypothetical protein